MVFVRIGHGSCYHHWNESFAGVIPPKMAHSSKNGRIIQKCHIPPKMSHSSKNGHSSKSGTFLLRWHIHPKMSHSSKNGKFIQKWHIFLRFDVSLEKSSLSPSPYNMASSCTNDDGSVPFNKALHHAPVTQRTLWTPIFSKIAQAGVPHNRPDPPKNVKKPQTICDCH